MTDTCALSLSTLQTRLWERLDDDNGVYYTATETKNALNKAQRLFCFLTLCYEKTVTFDLTNSVYYYPISGQISDFLCALRVYFNNTRLIPSKLHSFDAHSDFWRTTVGAPTHYAQHGFDALFTNRFLSTGSNSLVWTYAAEPPALSLSTDTPVIPDEQQIHLLDFAYAYLRLKEGGQEMAEGMTYMQRFGMACAKYNAYTLARSK